VIPDGDIAAKLGKDLFLDEKIPRHESGQRYVRVVEHSVLWKEKEASKVFTYQGLTTCTEVDRSWTIMSSAYNHVRSKRGEDERSMAMFMRSRASGAARSGGVPITNVEGAASSTSSTLGDTAARRVGGAAPPFFPIAGRGAVRFWGHEQRSVEPSATNEGRLHTKRV
jgi:hypothetical protein